jgi:hypothetical protein
LGEIFVVQVKSRQGLDTLVVVAGILPPFFKLRPTLIHVFVWFSSEMRYAVNGNRSLWEGI